jgi:ketosteroid isomerase-like protein
MRLRLTAALVGTLQVSAVFAVSAPRDVVRSMFDAFNRHDAAAMAALYADDARLSSPDFCGLRGKNDVERTYNDLFKLFPDIRDDVDTMIAAGGRVAVRFTARSSAGNQPLDVKIMTFLTVRDGRITEDDSLFDTQGRPCSP